MARRSIAQVVDNTLQRLDASGKELPPIIVGAHDWYTWLDAQEASSFAYRTAQGAMTARRERRHGGWYWYAYRFQNARLRKIYLGKTENLTPQRLNDAIKEFINHRLLNASASSSRSNDALVELTVVSGQPSLMPSTTLLKTKLTIPPLSPHLLPRPHLYPLLNQSLSRLLTIVRAPAGFGKTTLLSTWIKDREESASAPLWLSLDQGDNHLPSLLAYLLAAPQNAYPTCSSAHLRSSLPAETLSAFINMLATLPEQITIVLDNYHHISNPDVHDAMKFLIDHLPPHVHLIIATRNALPFSLARLYLHGQVAELSASSLRFTSTEAHTFMTAAAPHIAANTLEELEYAIEGWPAGLQLAALDLQNQEATTNRSTTLTGSNHYLQLYLVEELLASQPAEIQSFLLSTTLLDRFNISLCAAISGQPSTRELIEQLEHEQFFLYRLDEPGDWYRYHHLFAETLRQHIERTQPERLPLLHRRASAWFEQRGFLEDAINHSLAAQDMARAASLIEQVAPSLLSVEELSSLQRWLASLPPEIVNASPRLCIISAWLLYLTTQADTFMIWLDTAEEALHAQEETLSPNTLTTLRAEIVALRAAYTLRFNDFSRAIATCNEALASLPPDNLYIRSLVLLILGLAYQRGVHVTAAAQALSEASNSSQAIGQSGHALVLPYVLIGQAELYESQGYPFQAVKLYHEVIRLTKGRIGHPTGITYALLGYIFAEWQNVTAARQYLLKAWDVGLQANNTNVMLNAAFFLIRLSVAQGHMNEATYWLQQFESFIQNAGSYDTLPLIRAIRAWLSLEQGNLEDALLWMQNYMPPPEAELPLRHEVEYFFQARVLIAAGRTYADEAYMQQAMLLLENMRQTAETIGRTKTVIDVLTLEVLVLYYQDDQPSALSTLERALSLAAPGKYIRVFVSKGDPMAKLLRQLRDHYKNCKAEECSINLAYVRRLLAAFTQPTDHTQIIEPTGELSLLEPLSWREREVLRLMAAGCKNQEIASELVIVTGTVKAHIHSIYRKLAVNGRVQAIARARALNLL